MLISILMVSMVCGQAVAQTGNDRAKFAMGITDTPEVGNNEIYTNVKLEVPINILVSGEYRVIANLRSSGISWETTSPPAFYDTGPNQVEISIPGDAIFDSGVQGPYEVSLSILDKDGEIQDNTAHTLDYSLEEFNTTQLYRDVPYIEEDAGWIILRFDKLVAEISKTSPIVNYYYNDTEGEEGKYTKAVLKIARIIAFNDGNNDGIPQDDEIKYHGNLLNHYWYSVIKYDNVYEIRQNANVIMKDRDFNEGPNLDVTFKYQADETKLSNQAVAMEIQMTEPLGATHLCVESILTDGSEMGDREFVFDNGGEYKGAFLSPDDDEQNYLRWQKKCDIEEDSGDKQEDCTFNYQQGADGHNMYATVGISTYTTSVTMNYNFGVTGDPWEPQPEYVHTPWIWFLGIGLAVIILAAAFFIQRKMAKKDRDKEVV